MLSVSVLHCFLLYSFSLAYSVASILILINMTFIFKLCIDILKYIASFWGVSYNFTNVIIFNYFFPVVFLICLWLIINRKNIFVSYPIAVIILSACIFHSIVFHRQPPLYIYLLIAYFSMFIILLPANHQRTGKPLSI